MRRVLLWIQFDGAGFFGWQRQDDAHPSVQAAVEHAVCSLMKDMGHADAPIHVVGASRTDTGVHARCFAAHVDLPTALAARPLRKAIDVRLPEGVSLVGLEDVAIDWHCRYASLGKCYAYRITSHSLRLPLAGRTAHSVPGQPDIRAMDAAASVLIGTHDFSAFATLLSEHEGRLTSQPDPERPDKPQGNVRTLHAARVLRAPDGACIVVIGDGFLRGMVRAIAGTLLEVGQGRIGVGDVQGILKAGDRRRAGANLPGHGLTLERTFYAEVERDAWIAALGGERPARPPRATLVAPIDAAAELDALFGA